MTGLGGPKNSEEHMGSPVQEAFDTALMSIQHDIVQEAHQIRVLIAKGKHANAELIAFKRGEIARMLRAIDFIKTQTGWAPSGEFFEMSHQWEDVL